MGWSMAATDALYLAVTSIDSGKIQAKPYLLFLRSDNRRDRKPNLNREKEVGQRVKRNPKGGQIFAVDCKVQNIKLTK